jgi:hypothetical protein
MSTVSNKTEVGELRPSQVLMTFGIGSIIDLPNVSVMVMGLDDWQIGYSSEISEERLLTSVQKALNAPVTRLLTPPKAPESSGTQLNPFDERAFVGVPVAPFPRWMVCPACQYLGPLSSDLFELKTFPYRPDKTCYVHKNCRMPGKTPVVVPARFVVACNHGASTRRPNAGVNTARDELVLLSAVRNLNMADRGRVLPCTHSSRHVPGRR